METMSQKKKREVLAYSVIRLFVAFDIPHPVVSFHTATASALQRVAVRLFPSFKRAESSLEALPHRPAKFGYDRLLDPPSQSVATE